MCSLEMALEKARRAFFPYPSLAFFVFPFFLSLFFTNSDRVLIR